MHMEERNFLPQVYRFHNGLKTQMIGYKKINASYMHFHVYINLLYKNFTIGDL